MAGGVYAGVAGAGVGRALGARFEEEERIAIAPEVGAVAIAIVRIDGIVGWVPAHEPGFRFEASVVTKAGSISGVRFRAVCVHRFCDSRAGIFAKAQADEGRATAGEYLPPRIPGFVDRDVRAEESEHDAIPRFRVVFSEGWQEERTPEEK